MTQFSPNADKLLATMDAAYEDLQAAIETYKLAEQGEREGMRGADQVRQRMGLRNPFAA